MDPVGFAQNLNKILTQSDRIPIGFCSIRSDQHAFSSDSALILTVTYLIACQIGYWIRSDWNGSGNDLLWIRSDAV